MTRPSYQPGRHFLQLPGPTNTPLRVSEAIARPTIDHRGPEFQALGHEVLSRVRAMFKTEGPVIIYPSSGTGAWEAALVNALSPGDHILMYETGWFATLWSRLAARIGLVPELLPGDWRTPVDAAAIETRLREDRAHAIKAVCVVHNETSTGVTSDIASVRRAIDAAGHPALLMVDTVSSLAAADYRHDEWGADVAVCGSQKGLMLPPGLSFNAVSQKALRASESAGFVRSYWDWGEMLAFNRDGFFPYTPATNLLQGLKVAIDMLEEEGLDAVFARHERAGRATRAAVRHWGFEVQCIDASADSPVLTGVRMPEGHSADALRAAILERSNMSLGSGLGQLADKVFRIGHVGDFSDPATLGTIAAIEAAMRATGVPHRSGGTEAAIEVLAGEETPVPSTQAA
ncbi:pyridoxal-phosphate-dependent aminotransferase family protein [Sphingomonas canadensis]|uniref:Pyridoxal-phosphate-dependent aminotransferase family protein n=1 Tax=Sphingomonas canadensis TaxID=1219257 RepID=A0ABW3H9S4_9SPHN|nr:aminotransferase class V-fold PLP-dependent enzyme [Sphingomonas canadensis]MCW3837624.1 aminotransferase class V-fold PLP-dependent enzyme [Sphingomonas canadensis]